MIKTSTSSNINSFFDYDYCQDENFIQQMSEEELFFLEDLKKALDELSKSPQEKTIKVILAYSRSQQ